VEVAPGGGSADALGSAGLEEVFLRACTTASDTITLCEVAGSEEIRTASAEVRRATFEVVRARDATHSAIALRRAESAGESETRKVSQDSLCVGSGMGLHLR
jgi:hypothetical protein